MTRAAKVLALSSWSAWRMSAMSKAAGGGVGGLLAVEHPEELAAWERDLSASTTGLPLRIAVEEGDDHGDLRGEAERFADVGVVVAVGLVGVVDAEERDGGAEDLHGRSVGGDGAEEIGDFGIEGARGGEVLGELG